MNLHLGKVGVWLPGKDATPEMARTVEALGYGALWIGGSPSGDLVHVTQLLDATEKLPIATGIINVWASPASLTAQSYLALAEADRWRVLLGIGIGHREATAEYRSPFDTLAGYVADLKEAGVPREHLVLAALGPRVLRLARDETAGAHPYLTTPAHTSTAREILGDTALLAPEQKVLIEADPETARATARPVLEYYLRMDNYARNFKRIGFSDADIASAGDRLVDALVLHGNEERITAGVQAHLEAGADHVCIQPIGADLQGQITRLAAGLV